MRSSELNKPSDGSAHLQGFVAKVLDVSGKKVFINVCSSATIAAPESWQNNCMPVEAKQALEAGRLEHKEECLRLDVGIGHLRDDKDHTGAACLTIDCILSPIVLKEAESDRKLKAFLVHLTMRTVEDAYHLQLQQEYKLPKMRYKGSLAPQVFKSVGQLSAVREKVQQEHQAPAPQPRLSEPRLQPQSKEKGGTSKQDLLQAGLSSRNQEKSSSGPKAHTSLTAAQSNTKLVQEIQPSASKKQRGNLSCAISLESRPVQRIVAVISSTSASPLKGTAIEIQGDQLFASAGGHTQLQVTLPFGVDATKAEVQLQGKQISVKLDYAPLQAVWAL